MTVDVQATFAATLVDEWVRSGVRHAAIAPGSRSTPVALALAADGRVVVDVFLDERAAAFFALGVGVATGVPAIVLTTSGTAAVELHPAVVEASHAGIPLLAVTADRPPELRDVGAPQTIDQSHLFGRAVRWFADPGVAEDATRATWRSLAARAVVEAVGKAGPVHLDLPFREPLVAEPGELPAGRDDGGPWHRAVRPAVAAPQFPVDGSARGLIVAGRGVTDPAGVFAFAEATGWPVLADPLSGCRVPHGRVVAAFDALLRVDAFALAHVPDVVLRVGAPPASKVLAQWLASSRACQVQVRSLGTWPDPDRTASVVLDGLPAAPRVEADAAWGRSWRAADDAAQAAFDRASGALTEPGIARSLVDAAPDGATIVMSSSMPVRDVEWYGRARDGVRFVANRGANGIDGVVSTALGVARGSGRATVALLGDLAFLHDIGGLLWASRRGVDCTLVVVDNDGGGIFSFLPQARAVAAHRFEQLFGTPHGLDVASVARAYGVRVEEATSTADLADAVRVVDGVRVVVARTDRAANVAAHDALHDAVAAAC